VLQPTLQVAGALEPLEAADDDPHVWCRGVFERLQTAARKRLAEDRSVPLAQQVSEHGGLADIGALGGGEQDEGPVAGQLAEVRQSGCAFLLG